VATERVDQGEAARSGVGLIARLRWLVAVGFPF
jgi:hypothetical protein